MLVVRLGAMGDILHALPAITALRNAHPQWFIGWAIEPQWRSLLCTENCTGRGPRMPIVDQIHSVPAKQWARSPLSTTTLRDLRRVRRDLREARYDLCIDLQGAVRSALIAKWARASRIIGEEKPREPAARWFFDERVPTRGVHVIEQAIEVANAVAGDSLPVAPPWLPSDENAQRKAEKMPLPFVLFNPGAGWGAKRWPIDRYATVAKQLHSSGYSTVVNVGPGEESLGAELVKLSDGHATALQLTLTELIATTRRASLVIAGDTGPLHLACALGKPVVGIFGPTDPARNGPYGNSLRVLRSASAVTTYKRGAAIDESMQSISADEVFEALRDTLRRRCP